MYQFKRDEQVLAGLNALVDVTEINSASFKYKSNLLTGLDSEPSGVGTNVYRTYKNVQIVVPIKHVLSLFRYLELPLTNTKLHLELSWIKNCMSTVGNNSKNDTNTFQITKTELHVPVVTLNTSYNKKLSDLLSKGFKRSVFWN